MSKIFQKFEDVLRWPYEVPKKQRHISIRVIDGKSQDLIMQKDGSEGRWYHGYRKAFPIEDERDTPRDMIKYIKRAEEKYKYKTEGYMVLSLEIGDDKSKEIIGGATVNRITSNDYTMAVFENSFIKHKYRNKGFGKLMKKIKAQLVNDEANNLHSKFVGVLAETEDPKKMSDEDYKKSTMDPKVRRKVLGKLGYKIIDFPYVQLPTSKDTGYVRHLDFLINPVGEKKREWKDYIPSKDVKKILDMFFCTFNKEYKSDPEYKKMVDYLSEKDKIPLKPLY